MVSIPFTACIRASTSSTSASAGVSRLARLTGGAAGMVPKVLTMKVRSGAVPWRRR